MTTYNAEFKYHCATCDYTPINIIDAKSHQDKLEHNIESQHTVPQLTYYSKSNKAQWTQWEPVNL